MYDNIGEDELTAAAVREEFVEQYSTGDVEAVFGTTNFDIHRQVGAGVSHSYSGSMWGLESLEKP